MRVAVSAPLGTLRLTSAAPARIVRESRRHAEERIGTHNFTLDDFQGLSMDEGAELIRHEPVEHAVIYSRAGKALYYRRSWPGDPYRVTMPAGKSGLIRGNVFVHNHPGSESFSPEDIWILLRHGAREVRAYGPERSFRTIASRRTQRVTSDSAIGAIRVRYDREVEGAAPLFEDLVDQCIFDDAEARSALTHHALRALSARYRFAYMEI